MMGQTSIARELLGRGTSQFQAVVGPMGLWYLGNGIPRWKCAMMEQPYQCRIPMGTRWCLIGSPLESCSSLDSTKMHTKI